MLDKKALVAYSKPTSIAAEAYRILRTNIQFSGVDRAFKTIAFTSPAPLEGKTTTVANLAVTFARAGNRVLLVDADLRKPRLHRIFGVSNHSGLTNVLAKMGDYTSFLRETFEGNLWVLGSGPVPSNPSELLSSNSMKNFVETVKEEYDMVLFDTSPVCAVTDAAILSTIVDATVLVVSCSQTRVEAARRAKDMLDKVKANVIGVVINKIVGSMEEGYSYYYYGEKKARK